MWSAADIDALLIVTILDVEIIAEIELLCLKLVFEFRVLRRYQWG